MADPSRQAMSSAPLAISRSGSTPIAAQIARVGSRIAMRAISTRNPQPDASAISHSAPTTPASVGSCIAVAPSSTASRASGTTLSSSPYARASAWSRSGTAVNRAARSVARMCEPSSAAALVSTSASPGRAPAAVSKRSRGALPTPVMTTRPALMPGATSVWPPSTSTFKLRAVASMSAATWPMSAAETPSGKSSVARTPIGSAPIAARSLQTTWTANRPAPETAVVIGSVVSTQAVSGSSPTAAASTPSAAPTRVSGRRAPSRPSTSPRSRSGGSLPV